jgi:hypothetical protein
LGGDWWRDHRVREAVLVAFKISICAVVVAATLRSSAASAGTDVEELRRLHDKVMRAHLQGNIDLLLEDEAAEYVVAGRGEVSRPGIADRRARLGSYLDRTKFQEYRDVAEPLVSVSTDGTLGWVIVQVQARGIRTAPDGKKETVEFMSAWIELYQKRNDRWYRVGNVSNFRE